MAAHASEVASALRERLPGLPVKKLHKLLYYCQGHHLAVFGVPLFDESLSAWDMGPVVGQLWYEEKRGASGDPGEPLDEAQLNTVGYVVSRYGGLTGRDLENLTHSEAPWQRADERRPPGQSVRIEREWIESFFRQTARSDDDEDDGIALDVEAVKDWLSGSEERRSTPARPDSRDELVARLAARG
jgi:uncharacterized phage-associated protein